jgi:hypothetical protein
VLANQPTLKEQKQNLEKPRQTLAPVNARELMETTSPSSTATGFTTNETPAAPLEGYNVVATNFVISRTERLFISPDWNGWPVLNKNFSRGGT